MSVLNFVKGLSPMLDRREILGAITQVQQNLTEFTIPIAQDIQEALGQHTFRSKQAQRLMQQLRSEVRYDGNGVLVVTRSLYTMRANLEYLEGEVKKHFATTMIGRNMTYSKAAILRYIEAADFYARYFRKVFLMVIAEEAAAIGNATPANWSRAEREWLDTHQRMFIKLVPLMMLTTRETKERLQRGADAEVDEATFDIAQRSLGNAGTDPFQMNFIDPGEWTFNPCFSLGRYLAEAQVNRHKAAREERTALQLRLTELRELRDEGNTSPALQKQIGYTEKRVEGLDYKIETFVQSAMESFDEDEE